MELKFIYDFSNAHYRLGHESVDVCMPNYHWVVDIDKDSIDDVEYDTLKKAHEQEALRQAALDYLDQYTSFIGTSLY